MCVTAKMIYLLKSACQGACNDDEKVLRTTVNVRDEWCQKLCTYAEKHNIKPGELIRVLLKRMVKLMSKLDGFGFRERPMIYQKKGFSYSVMHLSVSDDEYSMFKDIMGCSRFCLSAILGMAMLIFDEIMAEEEEKVDSYPSEEYRKYKIDKNGMQIYINIWKENQKKRKKQPKQL